MKADNFTGESHPFSICDRLKTTLFTESPAVQWASTSTKFFFYIGLVSAPSEDDFPFSAPAYSGFSSCPQFEHPWRAFKYLNAKFISERS